MVESKNVEDAAIEIEARQTEKVVGHFVIVQVKGAKNNPQLDKVVGVFHNAFRAHQYASHDIGLIVIEVETLD